MYRLSLRLCALFVCAAITCACSTRGNVRPAAAPPDPRESANRLLNQGNYAGAGAAFEALAADGGPQAGHYRAIAALAYQDAESFAESDRLLAVLEGEGGDAPVARIAKARSMAHAGLAEDAYTVASNIPVTRLTPYQRGALTRVLGRAALDTRRYEAAAAALVESHRYPAPTARQEAALRDTWQALSRMPRERLDALSRNGDGETVAWYALALGAATSMTDQVAFSDHVNAWRAAYPGHRAEQLIEFLQEQAEALAVRPRHVALLLPFNDSLRPASTAIRDGLMTAWYSDGNSSARPRVTVYAIDELGLEGAVERALADDADFIIGPLRKAQVAEIRADSDLDISVLALNVVDDEQAARVNFYQFGLTPENEAEQVARRAQAHGKRALIVVPDSPWGKRLGAAFEATWLQGGGEVAEISSFAERSDGYAEAVKTALNVDLSEMRGAALRRRLGLYLHEAPRRRTDIDIVLLAAFPAQARQVMPQLRYFGAESVPVFATSHVYNGSTNAATDVDLNNITFGDMPWLFGAADQRSRRLIASKWASQAATFGRLYAFGIDAYRLLPYLGNMRFQPGLRIPGVTGTLAMDSQGIIQRNMVWLRFADGEPRLLDGAPQTH